MTDGCCSQLYSPDVLFVGGLNGKTNYNFIYDFRELLSKVALSSDSLRNSDLKGLSVNIVF